MKTRDHGSFDPKIFTTAVTPNGSRVCPLHVMPLTRGNACILEAGRRRSGPAGCASLARTEVVAGCVSDRKNKVVAPILVAIREAYVGARVVVRRLRCAAAAVNLCLLYTSPSPRD